MHYYGSVERTQIDEFYTVRTGLPQFYSSVEGTFQRPTTRNLYFGRVDWQINNSQNFFARYLQEDELTPVRQLRRPRRIHGQLRPGRAAASR